MRLRAALVPLAALVLALTFAPPASAEGLYYTTATDGPLESPSGRLYGVAAESWVLFDPHQVYSLHLNSVYMWLDTESYIEAGWAWYGGDGPQAYVAYEREGYTTDQERIWLGPVQPGSWQRLQIAKTGIDGSGATRWECRIGDKRAVVYQRFDRATARVSSERQTYRDSGYGVFRGMTVARGAEGWQPWRQLVVQNGDQDYDGLTVPGGGFIVR
jgi:hypothetical protein